MINILIADDSHIMRQIIKRNLEAINKNINVTNVVTGRKALIEMERNYINVLFLDLNMPDIKGKEINGIDVVTYLHQKQKLDNMWIVIISANLTVKTKLKLEKFGLTHFIPKPFDKDKFMAVVLPMFIKLEEYYEN